MPMTPEKLEAVRRAQQAEADRIKAAQDREAARKAAADAMVREAQQRNAFASASNKLQKLVPQLQMQEFLSSGMNPKESRWYQQRAAQGIKPVALDTSAGLTPAEQAALQASISANDRNWQNISGMLRGALNPSSPVLRNQQQLLGFDPSAFQQQPPTPVRQAPVQPVPNQSTTQVSGYNPNQARQVRMHTAKTGGSVKGYAKGGSVTRGDGCAQRGKTKGKMR